MRSIFSGKRGYVHALIDAFGEGATIRRAAGSRWKDPAGYTEEEARFARSSDLGREGPARIVGGFATPREPTLFRRREERLEGVLSPIGLKNAPRAALDRLVLDGKEYRIEGVEELRVANRVVAYRLECVRA
ncbi:MAG: hypothetical protein ACOX0A_07280 [Thermoguttaceae bacterium]|jgi:hypothetical protein